MQRNAEQGGKLKCLVRNATSYEDAEHRGGAEAMRKKGKEKAVKGSLRLCPREKMPPALRTVKKILHLWENKKTKKHCPEVFAPVILVLLERQCGQLWQYNLQRRSWFHAELSLLSQLPIRRWDPKERPLLLIEKRCNQNRHGSVAGKRLQF